MAAILEFYSVFLPKINPLKMRLCNDFVAKLRGGMLPERVLLRNAAREELHVEVLKEDGEVYLDKGWPEFIEANGLKSGYFILFRYDGVSTFDVKIYDYSGCENYGGGKDDSDEVSEDGNDGPNGEDEDDSDDTDSATDPEVRAGASSLQRRPYPQHERVDSDAELLVEPGNLYFVAGRKLGKRKNQVAVPSLALRDFNIELDDKIFYRDPSGRPYVGRVSKWKTGQRWIGGWKSFCEMNQISAEDKCIFELITGSDRKCSAMIVHIVRK